MTRVSIIESSTRNDFQFKRPQPQPQLQPQPQPALRMKRKTPLQLREEQLKRRAHEKAAEKGTQSFNVSQLVNARVTQAYPVVKSQSIERCRPVYWKDKDGVKDFPVKMDLDNGSSSSNLGSAEAAEKTSKGSTNQAFRQTEKCIESALRSVVQLHLRDEKTASPEQIDMEKALKGFRVPRDPMNSNLPKSISSGSIDDVGPTPISSDICPSEISIPGKKAPLDLTLKVSLRLVSSSSLKWCHRIDAATFPWSCGCRVGPSASQSQTKEELFCKALSSWVYPQSTLPTPAISAMTLSKAKGDVDFLEKRRQDWENSFRNLYCMLRKRLCSIFYVYTSEFVVLFVGGNFSGEKWSCNAYLSKSTNSLRSVLRKHDVHFTMPLYHAEEEHTSADDLAELSEIEKRNLGQAVYTDYFADVDGTSHSLLSFTGNKSVHGLYDFLFNHRFFFSSLNGGDVPLIYSPVPFQNSSLNFPEVRCKEMRKADMMVLSESNENGATNEELSNSKMCYSIEINNLIIPPWVVSGICAAMGAGGTSFDSTFTIDHSSVGLNIALSSISHKVDSDATASSEAKSSTFGIPEAVLVRALHTGAVQRLSYTNGAYVAHTISIS